MVTQWVIATLIPRAGSFKGCQGAMFGDMGSAAIYVEIAAKSFGSVVSCLSSQASFYQQHEELRKPASRFFQQQDGHEPAL